MCRQGVGYAAQPKNQQRPHRSSRANRSQQIPLAYPIDQLARWSRNHRDGYGLKVVRNGKVEPLFDTKAAGDCDRFRTYAQARNVDGFHIWIRSGTDGALDDPRYLQPKPLFSLDSQDERYAIFASHNGGFRKTPENVAILK